MTASPFVPGTLVRHPTQPEWGIGQVQSAVGDRVTVNFAHGGKQLINVGRVDLELVEGGARPGG